MWLGLKYRSTAEPLRCKFLWLGPISALPPPAPKSRKKTFASVIQKCIKRRDKKKNYQKSLIWSNNQKLQNENLQHPRRCRHRPFTRGSTKLEIWTMLNIEKQRKNSEFLVEIRNFHLSQIWLRAVYRIFLSNFISGLYQRMCFNALTDLFSIFDVFQVISKTESIFGAKKCVIQISLGPL